MTILIRIGITKILTLAILKNLLILYSQMVIEFYGKE